MKRDVDSEEAGFEEAGTPGMTRRDLLARGAVGAAGLAGLASLGGLAGNAQAAARRLELLDADPLSVPKASLKAARKVPTFVPPGPAFDISSAKGKRLFYHSITFGVQIVHTLYDGVKEGAEAAGLEVSFFDAKGRNDLILQGFQQALNQKPDLVLIESINNKLIDTQMKQLKQAGIKMVFINELYEPISGGTLPDALVAFDYVGGSTLAADWALVDANGGPINAAIFRANSQRHKQQEAAIRKRLQKYAKGKLKIITREVPFADFATRWPVVTKTVMTADPSINYIFPVIDGISLYVVPALHQAGAADTVQIATFNGTESVLKYISQGDVVGADTGGAQKWEGWLDVDIALRVLTGQKLPFKEFKSPNRLFDEKNIKSINVNEPEEKWYNTANAKTQYKKLWGVA